VVDHTVRQFRRRNRPVAPLPDAFVAARKLQLEFVPRVGDRIERKYLPSLLGAIGGVIEKHRRTIGFLDDGEARTRLLASGAVTP